MSGLLLVSGQMALWELREGFTQWVGASNVRILVLSTSAWFMLTLRCTKQEYESKVLELRYVYSSEKLEILPV